MDGNVEPRAVGIKVNIMLNKSIAALTRVNRRNSWRSKTYSRLCVKQIAVLISALILAASAFAKSSCPLTEEQSQKAVAAWAKIANFLTSEPRCVNCHGGVNPYMEGVGLDPNDPNAPFSSFEHGGAKQEHEKTGLMDQKCKKCHNDMAPQGKWVEVGDQIPPPPPEGSALQNWTTAPSFLSFVDKDDTTLCRQIKRATGTADDFLGHLKNDNGKTNFAGTAFLGNRGLSEDDLEGFGVKVQPPSVSHAAVVKLGQDWVNAMGGKFQGDDKCGCELTHDKWSGMIRYVLDTEGDEGNEKGTGYSHEWSGSSTTRIIVSLTNGIGTAKYSVQGVQQVTNWHAGKPEWRMPEVRASSKTETSGQGKFPAIADVVLYQGKYQVFEQLQLQLAAQPVRNNSGNPIIGKQHMENCDSQHGCTGADTADVLALPLPPLAPLQGKVDDPNHIFGTVTLKKDGLGMSHKGVSIETMTVDLWRSPSN